MQPSIIYFKLQLKKYYQIYMFYNLVMRCYIMISSEKWLGRQVSLYFVIL